MHNKENLMHYSTTINYSNNMGTNTSVFDTLSKARQFGNDNAILGDTVVITEAYVSADDNYDMGDHIASWKIDDDPIRV
tara:strand:- start:229 stop:465 length:237 start_codon:yes stop_codon:yes gene_type:complete